MFRVRSSPIAICLLAAALAVPPASAEIAPEARPVVERHLEATGGAAAYRAIRSVRVAATVAAMGFSGATTVWTRRPDRRATETALGPLAIREGFDGAVAWRTDPSSGKVLVLDGKDLEEARASAYFDNERWLAGDQGGGRVRLAGVERDSSGVHDVLEVTPPVGRARRFFVNRETGLVDRVVARRDQMTIVSTLSDYRIAGGRRYPHRTLTRIEGMPANDLLFVTDSIRVDEEIPDSRFARPGAAIADVRYLAAPGIARLPFDYRGRHVWLRASLDGGEPADFLYDTGASLTVIDSAYAARIGLATEGRAQGQGAGAVGSAAFARLRSLRIADPGGDGVEIADLRAAVLSLNDVLAPFFWRDCAGVIGFDVIGRFVNEIDYDARRLTLHDPATFRYAGGGATVPFTLAGTVPAVRMTLDGAHEGEFRVDVGSSSTVDLHRPFVERHGLAGKAGRTIEISAGGFGGVFLNRITRMRSISIGPYSWERPIVSFSGAEAGALASEDYAGNLGNRLLERFTCTLDYERRVLHLEPGRRFREPDVFSRTGLQLARHGDAVRAMQVLEDSPAAEAGIREGDRVLAVDGEPIDAHTPDTLTDLFERGAVGRRVPIVVTRDGKKRKLTVTLREML